MNDTKKSLEERGLDAAEKHLTRLGFKVLERNWSCAAGTVSIVAKGDGVTVFADVQVESDPMKGFPAEDLGLEARERFEGIAACWRKANETEVEARYDIISFLLLGEHSALCKHNSAAMVASA